MARLRRQEVDANGHDAVPKHHAGFEAAHSHLLALLPAGGVIAAQFAHHLHDQGGVHLLVEPDVAVEAVYERVGLALKLVAWFPTN